MKKFMKRLLGAFLAFLFVFGTFYVMPVESNAKIEIEDRLMSFSDVKLGSWYYFAVRRMYSRGYMEGTAKREFSPSSPVTRSMFATVLVKVADAIDDKYPETSDFSDVRDGSWYTRAVNWATDNSYMSGYGNGLFGTKDNITREQLVLVLYSFACRNDYLVRDIDMTLLDRFVDRNELHDWNDLDKAVCWALTYGIISGMPGDRLAPRENATRAQLAQMISNFIDLWAENPGLDITLCGTDLEEYKIIYSDNNVSEAYAAKELAEYIYRTNGDELALCLDNETPRGEYEIIVGHTDREGDVYEIDEETLGNEGFAIETKDNDLIIAGGAERGTLYGVYEFLEAYLGWRFYNEGYEVCHDPGELLEIGEISDTQAPVFEYRDAHMAYYTMEDIAVKRRMNGAFHRSMEPGQGGTMSYAGGDSYFSHTLNRLAETGDPAGLSPNCCISVNNTAVYANVVKNVKKLLSESPYSDLIGVSQMDENIWCNCDECRRYCSENGQYSRADQMISLVNTAADAIAEDHPGTRVVTYAYYLTSHVGNVMPSDNVIVKYCPINMTFSEPINSPVNAEYYEELLTWAQACADGNLYYWDYPIILANNIAPNPNFYVIYENLKVLADAGVNGIFGEGRSYIDVQSKSGRVIDYYKDGEFAELRAYLYAKLLWDPYMSLDEYNSLIDEFMQDYYGDGWEYVRSAFDLIHEASADRSFGLWDDAVKLFKNHFDDETLVSLVGFFDSAYELAGSAEIRNNIARARSQIDSLVITKYWRAYRSGGEMPFTAQKMVEINERLYRTMVDLWVYPWNIDRFSVNTDATDFTKKPALELFGAEKY